MFSRSSVFSTIESYSRVKRKTINNRSALNEYPSRTISILFMLEEYYDLFFFSFHLSLWQSILSYWRERRSDARRQQKKNDELFLLFTVPYASISLFFTLALVRSVPFASLSLSLDFSLSVFSNCSSQLCLSCIRTFNFKRIE